MDSLLQDLRYALRALTKSPTFTAVALLTIAVGTGANATVFGFVSALLLRPAPAVADPGSLVTVFTSDFSSGPYGDTSYPDFLSLRSEASAFRQLAAEEDDAVAVVRTAGAVERVRMSRVTGDYFAVLGLRPALGRLLTGRDADPAAPPAAVIGYELWHRVFGGNPAVLDSVVAVSGRTYTIVGVAPPRWQGLDLGRPFEMWAPLVAPAGVPAERGNRGLTVIGRLRDGATIAEAQAQLSTIAARLAEAYPQTNRGTLEAPLAPRPMVARYHTRIGPQFRGQVLMLGAVLMAAVGLVLVIACANVASLLLSRGVARAREMAIRQALGAARRRLVQQLVTESVLLALAGGTLGLLFSLWTAEALPSFFPPEQARTLETGLDARAFLFVLGISIASSLLFGLAPALHASRGSTGTVLRGDAGRLADVRGGMRLRRLVVVAQVALCVVLLVGAGLLVQTVSNQLRADLGFRTRDAVVASVELPPAEFTPEQGRAYYDAVLERVRALPGVVGAAFGRSLPMSLRERRGFRMDGYAPKPGEDTELHFNVVSDTFFETLQMPVLDGRAFDRRDRDGGAPVAIVNELFADRYFGGAAVGRRITDSANRTMEIVGVVPSGRHLSVQEPPVPLVYYPLGQSYRSTVALVARTAGDARPLIETVRGEMVAVDRRVPVFRTITLASHLDEVVAGERLTAALLTVCGGMALLLATIGVYGVIAYAVIRRRREIGVRVALGARPRHVVRLVLGEGLGITAAGLAIGIGAAYLAARALAFMLYGVSASDPRTFLLVPSILTVVALLAAVGPARRALRLDPMTVLRQE